jgi:ribosomal protein S18 acetylase RimI-like enzyme
LSTTLPSVAASSRDVELRPAVGADADAVARILHEAFAGIHDRHAFDRDFPTLESAAQLAEAFIAHPSIWGVVAERDGRIVGSNFVDERGAIRGVGPITVDPAAQERGVGRRLMEAVLDRSAGAEGVRLLQDSFNTRSLALYASLGFRVAEPVVLLNGRPESPPAPGYAVRPLTADDLDGAAALARAVHGYDRTHELRDALAAPGLEPVVATRDERIVAYATTLTHFAAAHAVAESDRALEALIAGAPAADGARASFLLPVRRQALLRWALSAGLRIVKPMNYMVTGRYAEPRGAWIPSVLY